MAGFGLPLCLVVVFGCLSPVGSFAQSPQTSSLPRLAWTANSNPVYYTTEVNADNGGNMVVSTGTVVAKFDHSGIAIWAVTNAEFNVYAFTFLGVDLSNNVYRAGTADTNFIVVKLDSAGNELWRRQYHHLGSEVSALAAAWCDSSGNLYLSGSAGNGSDALSTNNIVTLKYDAAGALMWAVTYSGPLNQDTPAAMTVDAAGNVYVVGSSVGFGSASDILTIKYDPAGNPLWTARYNGPESEGDVGDAVALDVQGNVFVTGGSGTFLLFGNPLVGGANRVTLKYDSLGNPLWARRFQDTGYYNSADSRLAGDGAGGVYVGAGFNYRSLGHSRVFRYDAQGNILWNLKFYGLDVMGYDRLGSLAADPVGNVLVALTSSTLKLSPGGEVLWTASLTGQTSTAMFESPVPRLGLDGSGSVFVTYRGGFAMLEQVTVSPPAAQLVTPAGDRSVPFPASVFLNATGTELPAKMEFWDGETKLAEDTTVPFTFSWNGIPGGDHAVTARYLGTSGTVVTSPPVHINVVTNKWPVVAITNPASGSYFIEPASISLGARATDVDGFVTKVGYYAPNLLGESEASPYSLSFDNVGAGTYTLTARATDNEGAIGTSLPIVLNVLPFNSPPVIPVPLQDVTVNVGSDATFNVGVFGPPPLQFHWSRDGVTPNDGTNQTLILPNVQGNQAGTYTLVASNPYGQATNSARLILVSPSLGFRSVQISGPNQLRFELFAPVGSPVSLETSVDRKSWTTLGVVTNTLPEFEMVHPLESTGAGGFYRLSVP